MKKIILIITGVVFVAVAAQAQSPRVEVSMANYGFGGMTTNSQRVASKSKAASKAQQQPLTKRLQAAITRAQAKAQAQQAAASKANKPAAEKTAQQKKPVQKTASVQAPQQEGNVGQWLKAIFLGGKFPGESTTSYHDRLIAQSQPSALPFK